MRHLWLVPLLMVGDELCAHDELEPYVYHHQFVVVKEDTTNYPVGVMADGYRAGRVEASKKVIYPKEFVLGFSLGILVSPLGVWLVDDMVRGEPAQFYSYFRAKNKGPEYLQGFLMGYKERSLESKKSQFHFGGLLGFVSAMIVIRVVTLN